MEINKNPVVSGLSATIALWNNREVVQHLRWANSNNYFQLSLYKDIEKEANDLIRRIETELQRDK